ncbi:hypothetical protein [Epilithonimonas mollis]|uniref:hypothetical protein n=1 Tax=Epilithonimonas mollis TaxID=216903 RepID=UPI0009328E93|nr:hypothetical protein [Epilithonimonas mollis]
MKKIVLTFIALLIFLASFQRSLVYLDYQFNKTFYEINCINKSVPNLGCHGKCQAKLESEKQKSTISSSNLGFEIQLMLVAGLSLVMEKISIFYQNPFPFFNSKSLTGFYLVLLKPPQI